MKKIAQYLFLLTLILSMLCPMSAAVDQSDNDDAFPANMIRVGLYYGSEVKSEVHLKTTAALGFRIGFYDESRTLHAIASVGNQNVIIAPNTNATLSNGDVFGIHLRLPATFESFEEASDNARRNGGFPAFCNGLFYVMIGSYATPEEAQSALDSLGRDAEIYYDAGRGVLVLSENDAQPLFLFDYSSTHALVLSPHDNNTKPVTQCEDNRYYGDFQFNRVSGNSMTVVNCVALEDYVKGVVPNEMSSSWPIEALKAQAVCARTYALKNLNSYRIYGFDVTDDTSSQVYRGLKDADETTDAACEATAGEVLRYHGELCAIYYFAADGGATESAENVWNDLPIPYLKSVSDPYESELDFYCKSWGVSVSHSRFGDIVVQTDDNGNVRTVTVGDTVYRNDAVRNFLVLVGAPYNSRHFTLSYHADTDAYTINGSGYGHNLGMSQWGAFSMAQNHEYSYREILSYYFTGATVE